MSRDEPVGEDAQMRAPPKASPFCKGRSRLCQRQVSGSSEGGVSLPRALRRYSDGGTPTWLRKKRVKLLCAEKPSSAETSEILPSPEDRREIAVSTHSMSREARGEKPVHSWNRS